MGKRVLLLAGDAVEALEVIYPYYRLLEEGMEADIASPSVKTLHTVVHDFTDWETYTEKPGYLLESQVSFENVDPARYDGLIIPGGRAPEHIRLHAPVKDIVRHFFDFNKPVGAICHAVQVLEIVPEVMKGRSLTAYQACRPSVEGMQATYVEEPVFVDGNLVSAHAWPDLPGFMREFFRLLHK